MPRSNMQANTPTQPTLDPRTVAVIEQYQRGLIGLPHLIEKLTARLTELQGGLNAWGNPRSSINGAEYCPECERTAGTGHYDFCPYNSRNSGSM